MKYDSAALRSKKKCEHILHPWEDLGVAQDASNLPLVGDVRGSHLIACVECVTDKRLKHLPPPEWEVGWRIDRKAMRRGLVVRPLGHLVVLSPQLLRASVEDTLDKLVREGWRLANLTS